MTNRMPAKDQSRDIRSSDRRAWVERRADRLVPSQLLGHRDKVLYLVVGGWNTLAGYGAFAILYYLLSGALSYAVIIVMSYAIAIVNAYLGYRYVAFRSQNSIVREFPRFSAVYLATMVVNLAVFPVALRALPLGAYVVQALFTVAVVAASYLAHRNFSFRRQSSADGKSPPARTDQGAAAGLAGLDKPASGGE